MDRSKIFSALITIGVVTSAGRAGDGTMPLRMQGQAFTAQTAELAELALQAEHASIPAIRAESRASTCTEPRATQLAATGTLAIGSSRFTVTALCIGRGAGREVLARGTEGEARLRGSLNGARLTGELVVGDARFQVELRAER